MSKLSVGAISEFAAAKCLVIERREKRREDGMKEKPKRMQWRYHLEEV